MNIDILINDIQSNSIIKDQEFDFPINFNFDSINNDQIKEIEFDNCTFRSQFYFLNLPFVGRNIFFKNCKFKEPNSILFDEIECNILHFKNCDFELINIGKAKIEDLLFTNCLVNKRLHLYDSIIEHFEIDCDQNRKIHALILNSPGIAEASISSYDFAIEALYLRDLTKAYIVGNIKTVSFDINKFQSVQFKDWKKGEEYLNSKIHDFKLIDLNFEGILSLHNIDIENLKFDEISCDKGGVRLNEVTLVNSEFTDCTLASFQWNQVKFINNPEIIRCDLSGLKMTNVTWSNEKKLKDSYLDARIPWFYGIREKWLKKSYKDFEAEDVQEMQYQRDTYRQLKAASLTNHNHIEALDFYRNEMRLYWKEIRINGGVKWYNRILVFLNRWSSDFGQNWLYPIIGLIVLHSILFSCILNWNYFSNGITGKKEFAEFAMLLNPTHSIPKYVNTGFGYITDLFMRVSIAYFAYHLIKATRKHGKA